MQVVGYRHFKGKITTHGCRLIFRRKKNYHCTKTVQNQAVSAYYCLATSSSIFKFTLFKIIYIYIYILCWPKLDSNFKYHNIAISHSECWQDLTRNAFSTAVRSHKIIFKLILDPFKKEINHIINNWVCFNQFMGDKSVHIINTQHGSLHSKMQDIIQSKLG